MNTFINNANTENNTNCNDKNMQEGRQHHRMGCGNGPRGPHGHGPHGGKHGKGKKWIRLIKNLVKNSKVTVEEIHECAQKAGLRMPIDFIKARINQTEEHQGPKHFHQGGRPDFGANKPFLRIVDQLMKLKNFSAEDLSAFATAYGMQIPPKFIENKLAKMNKRDSSSSGARSHSPRKHQGRPMICMMKQFFKANNIDGTKIAEFAKEHGFKMPAEKIDAFLNNKGFGKGGNNMRNRSRSASPKEEQKVETSSSDETEEDKATLAQAARIQARKEARQAERKAARQAERQAQKAAEQAKKEAATAQPQEAKQPIDELELYQLALKLHQTLNLGTFDECVSAVRSNNLNEVASVETLMKKNN